MTLNTACGKCGGTTRLVGIEPHPRRSDTDVWTFECGSCGNSEIAARPLGTMAPRAQESASGQTLN